MSPEVLKAIVRRPPRALELPQGFVDAAVLVPVWEGRLLFTVRSADLPHHAAQVSFPGGRLDPEETIEQAALREAWEEVGLEPGLVEILGRLDPTFSPFGFRVFPLLAQLRENPRLRPNPLEVSEILWVPVEELLRAPAYAEERATAAQPGVTRRRVWHYPWRGYDIWGVTGNIVHDFLERIKRVQP
ncbi:MULTISPECIES: CoA pyrophosphatase [unclassified Meiothermus]|uniref:NUDIX hydrolase n=1 Tax=unclassified Meiothermus TaxID=370471 RepID=UPI000D7CB46E|nr:MULTISPECIES: CoA pyrophosphatase [unclassified Meiothermus]PZA06398.1 coenzyme A pyrophosphatase [Meiothermus sp. Pnk-1]RYM36983.1 CoA pyrophosphatase [Meiothermus sp. PNK-Is4]